MGISSRSWVYNMFDMHVNCRRDRRIGMVEVKSGKKAFVVKDGLFDHFILDAPFDERNRAEFDMPVHIYQLLWEEREQY